MTEKSFYAWFRMNDLDGLAFEHLCKNNPEIAVMADPKAFYEWMHEQTRITAQAIVRAEDAEKNIGRVA